MPIYTLGHLAFLSGVPYGRLRSLMLDSDSAYSEHRMAKKSGGFRVIRSPNDHLKMAQRFILDNCLPKGPSSDISYAYTTGRGTLGAATMHVGARAVIKLDFADFFHAISSVSVYRIFAELGYPELLAYEMALICTYGGKVELTSSESGKPYRLTRRRFLAQGSPTSGALSNLALKTLDESLLDLELSGYNVTRYADDIVISSTSPLTRRDCESIMSHVIALSAKHSLHMNTTKTKVLLNKTSYRILGLTVTSTGVGLTRPYKRRFEQELFGIRTRGLAAHAAFKGYATDIEYMAYLWGHVAYGKGIDHAWGQRMRERLRVLNVPFVDVVGLMARSVL